MDRGGDPTDLQDEDDCDNRHDSDGHDGGGGAGSSAETGERSQDIDDPCHQGERDRSTSGLSDSMVAKTVRTPKTATPTPTAVIEAGTQALSLLRNRSVRLGHGRSRRPALTATSLFSGKEGVDRPAPRQFRMGLGAPMGGRSRRSSRRSLPIPPATWLRRTWRCSRGPTARPLKRQTGG